MRAAKGKESIDYGRSIDIPTHPQGGDEMAVVWAEGAESAKEQRRREEEAAARARGPVANQNLAFKR